MQQLRSDRTACKRADGHTRTKHTRDHCAVLLQVEFNESAKGLSRHRGIIICNTPRWSIAVADIPKIVQKHFQDAPQDSLAKLWRYILKLFIGQIKREILRCAFWGNILSCLDNFFKRIYISLAAKIGLVLGTIFIFLIIIYLPAAPYLHPLLVIQDVKVYSD